MTADVASAADVDNMLVIDPVVFSSLCDQAREWPLPGHGCTGERFRLLSAGASSDLVMGRLVEAHADAVAITAELGCELVGARQRWGVWAAGPADSLRARRFGESWQVSGIKPWCSGATLLTHALVDAGTDRGQQLFAVDLNDRGVSACPPSWVGPGMARADTRSVSFQRAIAIPVGAPSEYVARPGFWVGAIGVAACWHGGTVAAGRLLLEAARRGSDPHLLAHLGAVHVALMENQSVLDSAAVAVDREPRSEHGVLARSVRSSIERNAAEVLDRVGRALGPAPLARDRRHSALVADLMVYVRQHHAERDLEEIGREAAGGAQSWLIG
jgi:alkylation response protein AidB-like acyl-CoA dehydrogenase